MEKTLFSKKIKKSWGNTRTTQQPPLLLEEVKQIASTDIFSTSGTGKAMEPWREGTGAAASQCVTPRGVRQFGGL